MSSALSCAGGPLSQGDHAGVGVGLATGCSSGQVLFCQFLWNAKGVFCFILGFFCFFCFFVFFLALNRFF